MGAKIKRLVYTTWTFVPENRSTAQTTSNDKTRQPKRRGRPRKSATSSEVDTAANSSINNKRKQYTNATQSNNKTKKKKIPDTDIAITSFETTQPTSGRQFIYSLLNDNIHLKSISLMKCMEYTALHE